MKDVIWSEKAQVCKDVMANHPAPLLVRVEQGYCSEEDGESLGQGQVRKESMVQRLSIPYNYPFMKRLII